MERNVLVTGAKGMLGRALVALLEASGETVISTDLPEVDLAEPLTARQLIEEKGPRTVFHCAAYTNVDGAEREHEICYAANVRAPQLVAQACEEIGARMIFVSTDFVFDGSQRQPYRESDLPRPLSYYAQTKWMGEMAVAEAAKNYQVVRSAWLYGAGKRNFVTAICAALEKDGPVNIVEDEVGNPTNVADLARGLIEISHCGATGIFHYVNSGYCSRFEFGRAIAQLRGADPARIRPIRAADWPSPAARPAWSVLDCGKLAQCGIAAPRPWHEALQEFLAGYGKGA